MEQVQLSPNLTLKRIEKTDVYDHEIVSVCGYFSFHDKEGTVDINISATHAGYAVYISEVDICNELLYNFNDELNAYWNKIVKEVISYSEKCKKERLI